MMFINKNIFKFIIGSAALHDLHQLFIIRNLIDFISGEKTLGFIDIVPTLKFRHIVAIVLPIWSQLFHILESQKNQVS